MRPAKFRIADRAAANVQVADDRDFDAHRMRDTEARKVADENYFGSSVTLCQTKFSEFEALQKLWDEDLEVLKQAISILHNGVKPALQRKLSGPAVWRSFACVLLGLGGRRGAQPTLVDACNFAADPLVKVRVFIKEQIVRLKEDSAVEAEHKGWCDGKLQRNG